MSSPNTEGLFQKREARRHGDAGSLYSNHITDADIRQRMNGFRFTQETIEAVLEIIGICARTFTPRLIFSEIQGRKKVVVDCGIEALLCVAMASNRKIRNSVDEITVTGPSTHEVEAQASDVIRDKVRWRGLAVREGIRPSDEETQPHAAEFKPLLEPDRRRGKSGRRPRSPRQRKGIPSRRTDERTVNLEEIRRFFFHEFELDIASAFWDLVERASEHNFQVTHRIIGMNSDRIILFFWDRGKRKEFEICIGGLDWSNSLGFYRDNYIQDYRLWMKKESFEQVVQSLRLPLIQHKGENETVGLVMMGWGMDEAMARAADLILEACKEDNGGIVRVLEISEGERIGIGASIYVPAEERGPLDDDFREFKLTITLDGIRAQNLARETLTKGILERIEWALKTEADEVARIVNKLLQEGEVVRIPSAGI